MLQDKEDFLYIRYKKMFEPLYDISICKKNEINSVIEFIDKYWKKDHPLAISKELMEWQHYNEQEQNYNFILARSRTDGEIHALEGFIPTSQFDAKIKTPMTWGAIWKTREDVAPPGLGVAVKQYREHQYSTPFFCEIGISGDAKNYNKQLGNTVYGLEPWYMVNPYLKKYELISIHTEERGTYISYPDTVSAHEINIKQWASTFKSIRKEYIPPFKSANYYYQRFFQHPIYNYHALLISDYCSQDSEIIIYRIATYNDKNCLLFVDYIGLGDILKKSGDCLRHLLLEYEAEYILFLCNGLDKNILQEAGFRNRWETNDIVPVYFEPFSRTNIDILCASRSNEITWLSFKGDADQDRPNIIL